MGTIAQKVRHARKVLHGKDTLRKPIDVAPADGRVGGIYVCVCLSCFPLSVPMKKPVSRHPVVFVFVKKRVGFNGMTHNGTRDGKQSTATCAASRVVVVTAAFDGDEGLLEKLSDGRVGFRVFLHDLGDGHFKILLCHMDTPFTQGIHTRFRTDTLDGQMCA